MPMESWVVTGPQVIEVEDVRALRAAIVGGRVDVVGRDGPGARIEVHRVQGRPLEVSLDGGELRVGYAATLTGWESFLERFRNVTSSDAVDVHVAVPHDVAVTLGTVSGEGLLADVARDASVSTVSGSLVTDGTAGTLVANAVSGDLALRAHRGDLRVHSVSGSVTGSGAFGRAAVTTVSGAVTLDADTSTGLSVKTVSGDVNVRVPRDLGLSVGARSVSGRVVVDGVERGGNGPLRGPVEVSDPDARCRLDVSTVSGHLTVLRGSVLPEPTGPS